MPQDSSGASVTSRVTFRIYDFLLGPRAAVTWFLIAQPVTAIFWVWVVHRAIPLVLAISASQSHAANLSTFYVMLSSLVVLLFPLAVIDLLGGFLFRMTVGFPLALATKTSGSVLCFLLSRHTCSGYLRRTLLERYEWLGALSLMMKDQPLKTMILLRFSAIPAAVKNYGCGGFEIPIRLYTVVTALSLSLESLLLVPVGASAESWRDMITRRRSTREQVAYILGLLALLGLIIAIQRTVRQQIEKIRREAEVRDTLEAEARTAEQGLATFDAKEAGDMMQEDLMQEADGLAGEEARMLPSARPP